MLGTSIVSLGTSTVSLGTSTISLGTGAKLLYTVIDHYGQYRYFVVNFASLTHIITLTMNIRDPDNRQKFLDCQVELKKQSQVDPTRSAD